MRIDPIVKQKLECQYDVWEIKGSNPFTDPGYEVKCEVDEYVKNQCFYTTFFWESPIRLAKTGARIMNQSAYFALLIK